MWVLSVSVLPAILGWPSRGEGFWGVHGAMLQLYFWAGGGLWACPRLRRGKAKAAGERVAASAWQGLVLGCSLGGPHPRPLHLPPPSPGGIGAQGPLNPYLQLGFPVLPQFPHLQNGVNDTEPPLKTFRGSSKALYRWGDSGDMGGGGGSQGECGG